jgi:hypothetical protein
VAVAAASTEASTAAVNMAAAVASTTAAAVNTEVQRRAGTAPRPEDTARRPKRATKTSTAGNFYGFNSVVWIIFFPIGPTFCH